MKSPSIDKWMEWLSIFYSPQTCQTYRWQVDRLQAQIEQAQFEQAGSEIDIVQLDAEALIGYVAKRRAEGKSDASIKNTINALRSFYRFVQSEAADALPIPTIKKRVHRTLTWKEANAVLMSCDTSAPLGRRDLAIMAVMLDTGLRAAEICRLELRKIDLEARLLWVITKGGNENFGAFSLVTANYLSAWLAVREPLAHCSRAFTSFEGHRVGGEITPDGLRCIFRAIGRRATVPGFSPHVLRRSFAVFMTLMGSPTRLTQLCGRWARIEEVEDYTRAAQINPDLIAPYLPMNRLGGLNR